MSMSGTARCLIAICFASGCATAHDDPYSGAAAADVQPLIMLVVDTSMSMELEIGCHCRTLVCTDCDPDCSAADKSRWVGMLEALTGTFEDFSCATPSDDFYTYDSYRARDYHAPSGTQLDDGVLDTFASRVRFGIATFDGVTVGGGIDDFTPLDGFNFAVSRDAEGLWSYPSTGDYLSQRPDGTIRGVYRYPGAEEGYFMDTGIRNSMAEHGALSIAYAQSTAEALARDMQDALLVTRPVGGTPTAAALDDLFWLFTEDPESESERARPASQRHVVLITDGRPDSDYRTVPLSGCNCSNDGSCEPPPEGEEPYGCPYPTAQDAARALRCGYGEGCDRGVVGGVHVIAYDVAGPGSVQDLNAIVAFRDLNAIADGGGTDKATSVTTVAELRDALSHIIERILEGK